MQEVFNTLSSATGTPPVNASLKELQALFETESKVGRNVTF
jgi:hypothetical protein